MVIRPQAGASSPGVTPDSRFYDDLTRLNNERVTTQWKLVEFQMEIEVQKDELNREINEQRKVEDALRQAKKTQYPHLNHPP